MSGFATQDLKTFGSVMNLYMGTESLGKEARVVLVTGARLERPRKYAILAPHCPVGHCKNLVFSSYIGRISRVQFNSRMGRQRGKALLTTRQH